MASILKMNIDIQRERSYSRIIKNNSINYDHFLLYSILSDLKEIRIAEIENALEKLKTPNTLTMMISISIHSTYSSNTSTPPTFYVF